ncbi:MAG: iron (metal) dependent repressor, DtxR family [Pedosphaera sp.]|nr:iron (metal) dependent repressor, DtxR family [Pedosphaera sp.]
MSFGQKLSQTACAPVIKGFMQQKRKPANKALGASESTEDHLERIATLIEEKGYARVTDVAAALDVSPSTVSNMVRRLAARGFVKYERYRGFTLTADGHAVAARIKARHQTLTDLFGLLGLAPETIDSEVEEIEHSLRPQTLQILRKLVDYWRSQPEQLTQFLQFARKK